MMPLISFKSTYKDFPLILTALIIGTLCLFSNGVKGQSNFTPQPTSPLDLLPSGQETHTVLNSGNWSDANTWTNGTVPTAQAKVLIPAGKTLTVDGEIATRIKIIRNDGKLQFSTSVNTALNVETIVQGMMGELEMGTSTNPIPAGITSKITIIDEGDITDYTSSQFEKGLVLMGKTVMYGADKTDWLRVAANPALGATTISLPSAPSGWEAGDRIAISGTSSSRNPTGDEVATIASVSGNVVTLTTGLTKDHTDVPASDLRVHVANLTRNIVIESENADTVKLERGHIMFMHTLDVDMNNVRVYKMGRTNKIKPVDGWILNENPTNDDDQVIQGARKNIRGRYSIHFHRGGVDQTLSPAYVRGCVVENDPGWGYVNHSAYVHFEDNVSYDILGGAFQTEAGDELGSFKRNIAIRTINPNYPRLLNFNQEGLGDPDVRGNEQDFAFQGDAFWIHGGGVSLTGNVASGCSGHGFIYWPEGLREDVKQGFLNNFKPENVPNNNLLQGNEEVATGWVPVKEFKDNEAYSAIIGFSSYYLQTEFFGDGLQYSDAYLATVHSTFENLTTWNVYWKGVEINLTDRITFKNLRVVNNDGHIYSIGVHNRSWVRNRHIYDNATVEGFAKGMVMPEQGNISINCGSFVNGTNFEFPLAVQDSRDVLIDGITTGSHSSYPSANHIDINMVADFTDPIDRHPLYFLIPDRIVLNYGDYTNQRLYFDQQVASFVPIQPGYEQSTDGQIVQSRFVSLTNQQLQDTYQMSFGGELLPSNATTATGIVGGKIAPKTDNTLNMPTCFNYVDGRFLKISNFPGILECIGTQTNLVASTLSPFSHSACSTSSTCDDSSTPSAISSVTATNNGCTSIAISWSSSTCADDYSVERSTDGGTSWTVLSANTTSTSFTDSSPLADGTHQYRVRGQNGSLNSAYATSNTITCSSSSSNTFPANAKIMPFGASRTAGGGEYESHRYELWKNMLDNGWTLDYIGTQTDEKTYSDYLGQTFDLNHAGFGGQTSQFLLTQLNEELSTAGVPDIVFFSAPGGNDAIQQMGEVFNSTTTFANINAIIDAFQAANSNVTIFIEQPAPVGAEEGVQSNTNLSTIAAEIPNIATQQTTATSDVIVVDLNSNWSNDWYAGNGDVVHYNVAGAVEVARRYINVMNTYYSSSSSTQYTLTTSASTGGSVTAGGTYNDGTVVSLTATPDAGYNFSGWSGDATGTTNPLSVTMDADKTITANFTAQSGTQYTLTTSASEGGSVTAGGTYDDGTVVSLTATPDAGYTFSGWSGDASGTTNPLSVTMDADKTITANFTAQSGTQYELVTEATTGGTVTAGGTYDEGTVVELTATPDAGYEFSGWSGDATGTTNPLSVTMDDNKGIIANFTAISGTQYTLTTSASEGGSVTAGGTYDDGSVVEITATPDSGFEFSGWSGDASGTTNPLSVTIDADKTITANFTAQSTTQYTLTTSASEGGSVTAGGTYDDGAVVEITATPDSGFEFSGWSGDASGTTNPLSVTIDADKTITANFTAQSTTQYTLTTSASTGGSVTAGGTYDDGTVVEITATPDVGYEFSGWSGDASGTTSPLSVIMDSDKTVTANFTVVLSLEEEFDNSVIEFYPNPTARVLNVSSELTNYSIQIFSTDGRKVGRWENVNGTISLDTSGWDNGIYLMKIMDSNATLSKSVRIIKK